MWLGGDLGRHAIAKRHEFAAQLVEGPEHGALVRASERHYLVGVVLAEARWLQAAFGQLAQ